MRVRGTLTTQARSLSARQYTQGNGVGFKADSYGLGMGDPHRSICSLQFLLLSHFICFQLEVFQIVQRIPADIFLKAKARFILVLKRGSARFRISRVDLFPTLENGREKMKGRLAAPVCCRTAEPLYFSGCRQ